MAAIHRNLTNCFALERENRNSKLNIMARAIAIVVGIVLAAIGGVIAYRAYFLEPAATVVITSSEVSELPNIARVLGGLTLMIAGAMLAFLAGRSKKL